MTDKNSIWKLLSALLLVIVLIAVCGFQNAGNTGTQTVSQIVVYTAGVSQIFNNIGQSAHYIQFCSTSGNYTGLVDLEGSYDGATHWTTFALANYQVTPLSGCAVLQAGGYYQNVRSTTSATNISAWYNASSGPIAYAPAGLSDGGASAPTLCTHTSETNIAAGQNVAILAPPTTVGIKICTFQLSLAATPSTGALAFNYSSSNACTSVIALWGLLTFAGTPPVISMGSNIGALFSIPAGNYTCFYNTSGQTVVVDISYAETPTTF
jgi:hypothetical protein